MSVKKDDIRWKHLFGCLLTKIFRVYKLDCSDFCSNKSFSDSTIRYWKEGVKLPQEDNLNILCEYIKQRAGKRRINPGFRVEIHALFNDIGQGTAAGEISNQCKDDTEYLIRLLIYTWNIAKHQIEVGVTREVKIGETGRIEAVVFDFDGTLTENEQKDSTWELLWRICGYQISECQRLHELYNLGEISHDEWCAMTLDKFRDKAMTDKQVIEVANKIHLIDGVYDTLKILNANGIKIYIVSGSVDIIINQVLAEAAQFVNEIKSNIFRFDRQGVISEIIGTIYDFEGKANYIMEKARELRISVKDVLFVGNSWNDRFAFESGAKTLCINPLFVDPLDTKVWNHHIIGCQNLTEILPFVGIE